MKLWLLLALVFLIQEPVTADAVLLQAYQAHYNVWIIHAIFIAATLIDAALGYACGMYLHHRFKRSNNRFMRYIYAKTQGLSRFMGSRGRKFALVVYGPIIFPYSAVAAPWLRIPFREALVCLFLGDIIFWYGSEWLIVLGVKTFVPNPIVALFYVIAITSLITLGIHLLRKRH